MDFSAIEKKWQEKWAETNAFQSKESDKKPKFYCLEMFPYPSGTGLHMGHAFNYTIGDVYARFKRMNSFNVLYPMGYDSFGLPAENAAIKAGEDPKQYTQKAIANFVQQQKQLGLSYDWERMIVTYEPEYYKWNQFFFLKLMEKGLVYKKQAPANWCPECKTVLANEQVHNGKCWRHTETEVEMKNLEQWFFRITDYADELLEELPKLDWPERIKSMQENWIGKSHGVNIFFKLEGTKTVLPTYTTRCDTIFSVTFIAIAPEHPMIPELVKGTGLEDHAQELIENTKRQSIIDRQNEEKEKEGVFTGKYAINPINNEKVPIFVANFALMYGSGIVMCDAHDKRDFRFARKYDIPLKFVISKDGKPIMPDDYKDAFIQDGILFNSGSFSGMNNREALPKMAEWIEKKGWGKRATNYKLRDWLVSRQRYWGTPIPIVYCEKCGTVPVPEKELPVKLPGKVKFGTGNPLATSKEFVETKCPKCKGKAKRETDTMDTFVDSSWYFLRYCDNKNNQEPFARKKIGYWLPVNQYIGGAEHATMHLIYARFFTKALRDMGFLKFDEPFQSLFNQGMLHGEDGFVMSKSRGNVVNPIEMIEKYSADTLRFFLVSMASPDKDLSWSGEGIESTHKFIKKIADYFETVSIGKSKPRTESKLHQTIKEITMNIEKFEYHIATQRIRKLFEGLEKEESRETLESFLKLLSPFCPHLAEELFERIGNKKILSAESWPKADEKKINPVFEQEEKALEKLVEDINNVARIVKTKGKEPKKVFLYCIPQEKPFLSENTESIRTRTGLEATVFAVNEKQKFDPENKAGKAKPFKPAIYLE
jgi:leucyl-tRNA synthetase